MKKERSEDERQEVAKEEENIIVLTFFSFYHLCIVMHLFSRNPASVPSQVKITKNKKYQLLSDGKIITSSACMKLLFMYKG